MTDYPLARLVTSPDPSAAVRFDFHRNDGPSGRSWSNRAEWSWQPGTLLGEPDGTGADYSLGRLDLTLYICGSRADALRTMSALARELQRAENYMLFQLSDDSAPMWLKVYRPSAGALTFPFIDPDSDAREDVWVLPVSLPTESFALGEQVVETVTIGNNPATGGLVAVLPEIKGDAPAPLVVEIPAESDALQPLVAVTPLDVDWPGVQFWQAESWTNGTDTSDAADVTASGGNRVTITFATDDSLVVRLTGAVVPALAGTYRLFARVSGAGTTFSVKGTGDASISSRTQAVTMAGWQFVDLGLYAFPKWNLPTQRGYTLTGAVGLNDIQIKASQDSAGSLYVDYVVAIPCDLPVDGLGVSRMLQLQDTIVDNIVIDGESERLLNLTTSDEYRSAAPIEMVGDFPRVTPGATNVLHFLRRSANGPRNDDITDSTTLTLKYRPQLTYLPSD